MMNWAIVGLSVVALFSLFLSLPVLAFGTYERTIYTLNPPNPTPTGRGNLKAGCGGLVDPYLPIVNEAAAQYVISPAYVAAVIEQESAGDAQAGSGAGARGLMQLLDGTFAEVRSTPFSVQSSSDARARTITAAKDASGKALPNDIFDPRANIYAGTQYLATQFRTYGPKLGLAAYNAGPANEYIVAGDLPPYRETQDYVRTILQQRYPKYLKCLKESEATIGEGFLTNANATLLRDYILRTGRAQKNERDCWDTDEKVLTLLFNWGWGYEEGPGTQDRSLPPSQADLELVRETLKAGDLPVWHIAGEAGGEHWIVLLGIDDENRIMFYDPNGGRIRTEAYDVPSTTKFGPGAFFGRTEGSSQQWIRHETADISGQTGRK